MFITTLVSEFACTAKKVLTDDLCLSEWIVRLAYGSPTIVVVVVGWVYEADPVPGPYQPGLHLPSFLFLLFAYDVKSDVRSLAITL